MNTPTCPIVLAAVMATLSGSALSLSGCQTEPKSQEEKSSLESDARAALDGFRNADSGLQKELDRAAGYAVLPDVGKAGLLVGGSYGKGVVYENGVMVGYCDLTQGTVGLQAGAQTFSELIIFRDQAALDHFKGGDFTFAANASAVAIKPGAAASLDYHDGVAVLVNAKGGLMAEAAIGGQKLRYEPR
ncbi:MAG: hypothetical protein AMXMBFR58_26010 [Phycisphaerae bacterium]|nr:hypothetical protein [Phycisphaerales bacterium]MCK6475858.1 lipid-binding SYLF domain-containing protein [Phycisphaerales bacterium]